MEKFRMKSNRSMQQVTYHNGTQHLPEVFEIIVQGNLDSQWELWFEGMTLTQVKVGDSDAAGTIISGKVADQAALHGLLIKIRDLNLKLISVRRVVPDEKNNTTRNL
jgi:formylmethanofuran dehydrogenase subunit C